MRPVTCVPVGAALVAALGLAGCGDEGPASSPAVTATPTATAFIQVEELGEESRIPNPGTGTADPRLVAALLPGFQAAHGAAEPSVPHPPGAGVRFPVRDTGSMFFGARQISSPYVGDPACTKWTAGMWATLVGDFPDTTGVQLALAMFESDPLSLPPEEPGWETSLTFSQAIITAPRHILDGLADERVPAGCSRLTMDGKADGRIEPIPAAQVGDRSWAYRIVDAKGFVWHWVQVVRLGDHLIEIRIPNQEPGPRGDMTDVLRQIATEAHARAAKTLS